MTDLEEHLPNRPTNKEVANYVADRLEGAKDDIREEQQELHSTLRGWIESYVSGRIDEVKETLVADQRAFRSEIRWWIAGLVIAYQLHLNLGAMGVVGALAFGARRFLPNITDFFHR